VRVIGTVRSFQDSLGIVSHDTRPAADQNEISTTLSSASTSTTSAPRFCATTPETSWRIESSRVPFSLACFPFTTGATTYGAECVGWASSAGERRVSKSAVRRDERTLRPKCNTDIQAFNYIYIKRYQITN
jgi:hypothetical protein